MNHTDPQYLHDEYMGYVQSLAHRMHAQNKTPATKEDLAHWGFLGLVDAGQRFRPEEGVEFTTFARRRVIGAMYDGMTAESYWSRRVYRDLRGQEAVTETVSDVEVVDHALSPEKLAAQDEALSELRDAIQSSLKQREQQVVMLYFFHNVRMLEIGDVLGVSESRVSQLLTEALSKLRRVLGA